MPLYSQHQLMELFPYTPFRVTVSKIPQRDFETVECPRHGESRRLIRLLHVMKSYKVHAVSSLRNAAHECRSW